MEPVQIPCVLPVAPLVPQIVSLCIIACIICHRLWHVLCGMDYVAPLEILFRCAIVFLSTTNAVILIRLYSPESVKFDNFKRIPSSWLLECSTFVFLVFILNFLTVLSLFVNFIYFCDESFQGLSTFSCYIKTITICLVCFLSVFAVVTSEKGASKWETSNCV